MPVPSSERALLPLLIAPGGEGMHIGPFRLVRTLGRGGFAPVFLAEETYEGRRLREAAVKLFFPPKDVPRGSAEELRFREQILEEAHALCRVEHPNVVRFYSLHREDRSGAIGLAMEYVAGESLDVRLNAARKLEDRSVLEVGIAVAWALSAVHNAGLVHRDVKPGNIIQGALGYKLIDFGIVAARPTSREGTSASAGAPMIIGTPGYIAPECVELGVLPTPESDLYGLGATLFKLRYGALPPNPPPLRGLGRDRQRDSIADALSELLAQLLEVDPSLRPRHADWVARELERLRVRLTPASQRLRPSQALAGIEANEPTAAGPSPLAPLFARARRACSEADPADAGQALGDLMLGVVRYGIALGLAVLEALPESRTKDPSAEAARGAFLEQLRTSVRPAPASLCYLLRSLAASLSAMDPAISKRFSFAVDLPLAKWLSALSRGGATAASVDEGITWLEELLRAAGGLLSLPIQILYEAPNDETKGEIALLPEREFTAPTTTRGGGAASGQPYVLLDSRWIVLSPWLPCRDGRPLLPEAPAAPGKPWRASDPVSGERIVDPALDEAMRLLLGGRAHAPPELCNHPPLIGREDALAVIDRAASEARAGGVRLVLISGPLGIGRTRLLDAAIERAGFGAERVIRARCSPERKSLLRPLLRGIEALRETASENFGLLADAIERALAPAAIQGPEDADGALEGVEDALIWASIEAPLLLAIDDLHWGDPYTLDLLRLLCERAEAGGAGHLSVFVTARNEPNPSAKLRALLGQVRGKVRSAVKHLDSGPLSLDLTAHLAQAVSPLSPELERAVVRGSGGVPFFVVHALLGWRDKGAIAWHKGVFDAVDQRVLTEAVPGVADLVEARIASYFDPQSAPGRAALRALSAIALYGGGLGSSVLFRVTGDEAAAEAALSALLDSGMLTVAGDLQEYSFAQEMVRQAVLNMVRQRPWFYRLHRSLLDVVAEEEGADAAFLATGYDKLGAAPEARVWLERATMAAIGAGLFAEAAELGDRRVALAPSVEVKAELSLFVVRALVSGRRFEEAKRRLVRLEGSESVVPREGARSLSVRQRILRLLVARGLCEAGADDPTLITDADALGDVTLGCEARMALAGVLSEAQAKELATVAVHLAERCEPSVEFAARVLRYERNHDSSRPDLEQAKADLTRALSIAKATSSIWQQIHIEGDLVTLLAELGQLSAALERVRRLAAQAEALGMRGQFRLLSQNLSALLWRAGHDAEAAAVSQRTADLAAQAGDTALRARALSLRADVLARLGDLEQALACVDEAERLQRERAGGIRALSLLRRAEILDALERTDEALSDIERSRAVADEHGEVELSICADILDKLCRARRGRGTDEALSRAIDEACAGKVTLRSYSLGLIAKARAWLGAATVRDTRSMIEVDVDDRGR